MRIRILTATTALRTGSLLSTVLFLLVLAGLTVVIAPRIYPFNQCGERDAAPCPDPAGENGVGQTLVNAEVCPTAGYLCYGGLNSYKIQRWNLAKGVIHVRAPLPDDFADSDGHRMRSAAIDGILEWEGHPFRIDIDSGSIPTRRWDVELFWTPTLNDGAGVAHLNYEDGDGKPHFSVGNIAVQTQMPWAHDEATYDAFVQAIAAHEMGHALGLGHSDQPTDLMAPTSSRPLSVTARDLQTVDALYRLPAGAILH